MKVCQDTLLRFPVYVDQEIPTRQKVDADEGRIVQQILDRKQDVLLQIRPDSVPRRLTVKVALQPTGGDIGRDRLVVLSGGGGDDRLTVDVGAKNFERTVQIVVVQILLHHHGDAVGFLASGASRHPHPYLPVLYLPKEGGYNFLAEHVKGFPVAKKAGDPNQKALPEDLAFLLVLTGKIHVIDKLRELSDQHSLLDTPHDRCRSVTVEIHAGGMLSTVEERAHQVGLREFFQAGISLFYDGGIPQDLGQSSCQFGRWQHHIRQALSQCRTGHSVELGGIRSLYQYQPTVRLNFLQAPTTVGAHAR